MDCKGLNACGKRPMASLQEPFHPARVAGERAARETKSPLYGGVVMSHRLLAEYFRQNYEPI
jgi:hypothetical protein